MTTTTRAGQAGLRLCCILPVVDPGTSEHFFHTYALLAKVSDRIGLAVIGERGRQQQIGRSEVIIARTRWAPLRLIELTARISRLRLQGCRTFYVRYSYVGAWAGWIVTRVLGGELFYWHCTSTIFHHKGWSWRAWKHRLRAEFPLWMTMRLVDYLVTGSDALVQNYSHTFRLPTSRIKIVPNDIDIERFREGSPSRVQRRTGLGFDEQHRVVLFVHRLAERKGADDLPAIARTVCARDPLARVLIIGSGPLEARLRAELEGDESLKRKVRVLGAVANADMPSYYAAADLLIMPSREEGTPRVLLEAMAAGLPFVAADVGGVRDICGPGSHWPLVPVGNIGRFVGSTIALLSDPVMCDVLRNAGSQRVTAFSTDRIVALLLQELGLSSEAALPETADAVRTRRVPQSGT